MIALQDSRCCLMRLKPNPVNIFALEIDQPATKAFVNVTLRFIGGNLIEFELV
jgi:hypothetical protein